MSFGFCRPWRGRRCAITVLTTCTSSPGPLAGDAEHVTHRHGLPRRRHSFEVQEALTFMAMEMIAPRILGAQRPTLLATADEVIE